jgi:hypothetical protein
MAYIAYIACVWFVSSYSLQFVRSCRLSWVYPLLWWGLWYQQPQPRQVHIIHEYRMFFMHLDVFLECMCRYFYWSYYASIALLWHLRKIAILTSMTWFRCHQRRLNFLDMLNSGMGGNSWCGYVLDKSMF